MLQASRIAGHLSMANQVQRVRVSVGPLLGGAFLLQHIWRCQDDGGWTVGDSATDLCSRWIVDPSFEDIPTAALAEEKWRGTESGLWQHAFDTLLLRRIAVSRHSRQLFLGRNISLVLPSSRARSSSFPLLVQVRRFRAYALACWIHPSLH